MFFWYLLRKSFTRGIKSKLLAVLTVAVGTSLATAMLNVMLDIGDRMSRELKAYGANLQVRPRLDALPLEMGEAGFNPLPGSQYLEESDLVKIKSIFWTYNILDFAPFLEAAARIPGQEQAVKVTGTWFDRRLDLATGELFATGIRQLRPWWRVEGEWPGEPDRRAALVGASLAGRLGLKPGGTLELFMGPPGKERREEVRVSGILAGGGPEDDGVLVPLDLAQGALGLEGKVARVEVSALTTPDNELARKAERDPRALTAKEYETWYCTAYVSAIAYQIEEALPGAEARPIRRVAQAEGVILGKLQLLMLLLAAAALASAVLGISGLMTAEVLERKGEVGLLKALGAEDMAVFWFFLAGATVTGVAGGLAGYALGLGLAWLVGSTVFGVPLAFKGVVLPLALVLAVGVTLLGSFSALRLVLNLEPAVILKER